MPIPMPCLYVGCGHKNLGGSFATPQARSDGLQIRVRWKRADRGAFQVGSKFSLFGHQFRWLSLSGLAANWCRFLLRPTTCKLNTDFWAKLFKILFNMSSPNKIQKSASSKHKPPASASALFVAMGSGGSTVDKNSPTNVSKELCSTAIQGAAAIRHISWQSQQIWYMFIGFNPWDGVAANHLGIQLIQLGSILVGGHLVVVTWQAPTQGHKKRNNCGKPFAPSTVCLGCTPFQATKKKSQHWANTFRRTVVEHVAGHKSWGWQWRDQQERVLWQSLLQKQP